MLISYNIDTIKFYDIIVARPLLNTVAQQHAKWKGGFLWINVTKD